jgi:hypothetical protein
MKVYHYTAISYLQSILLTGVRHGEVATSGSGGAAGVCLTSDPDPSGHGLSSCRFLTPSEVRFFGYDLYSTRSIPIFPDKRKVRLTFDLPRSSMVNWLRWSTKNIEPRFRELLIQSGGGMSKARSWLVSWDMISADCITSLEVRNSGNWVALDAYDGLWSETFSDRALRDGYHNWGNRLAVGLDRDLFERAKHLHSHAVEAMNFVAMSAVQQKNLLVGHFAG